MNLAYYPKKETPGGIAAMCMTVFVATLLPIAAIIVCWHFGAPFWVRILSYPVALAGELGVIYMVFRFISRSTQSSAN